MRLIYKIIIVTCLLELTLGEETAFICRLQNSCEQCLYSHPECAWCSKGDKNRKIKCNTVENLIKAGCEEEFIELGKNSSIEYVKNEPLKDIVLNDVHDTIQIQPQHIKIKLRQNKRQSIKIQVRPSKNYPLELYFLMDTSFSMADDRDTIARLGHPLMTALMNLTENVRLGLGLFADKAAMPWFQVDPVHKKNPCASIEKVCEPLYDFQHVLSLTDNKDQFISKINETTVTANLDNLEGGLDALMQILVCIDEIGWSKDSRKIILMASDSLLHFAGDGILAGIVRPNDKMCHLDKDGYYSESLNFDYPSISQISTTLEKLKINVIFAVTESVQDVYDNQLKATIPHLTYVARLEEDSSNILNLIKQGYESIVSRLNLKDNSSDPIKIDYSAKCGKQYTQHSSSCNNVVIGNIYKFNVDLQFHKCPQNISERNQIIVIEETTLGSESVTIEVELLCGCDCADSVDTNLSADYCGNNGNLVCGICQCNYPWFGTTCECNRNNDQILNEVTSNQCLSNLTAIKCSGHGDCICGYCACDNGYMGKYCECWECEKIKGEYCNNHGQCLCGECLCYDGYNGENCECDQSKCLNDKNEVCSGFGECVCGKCICNDSEPRGLLCEKQKVTKNSKYCHIYEACVHSQIQWENGSNIHNDTKECRLVSNILHTTDKEILWQNKEICVTSFEKYCNVEFSYITTEDDYLVDLVIYKEQCQTMTEAAAIGIFLATVVIGACVILGYICYIRRQDKIEYAKFMKASQGVPMSTLNPLYKSPVTEYKIPKFEEDE